MYASITLLYTGAWIGDKAPSSITLHYELLSIMNSIKIKLPNGTFISLLGYKYNSHIYCSSNALIQLLSIHDNANTTAVTIVKIRLLLKYDS